MIYSMYIPKLNLLQLKYVIFCIPCFYTRFLSSGEYPISCSTQFLSAVSSGDLKHFIKTRFFRKRQCSYYVCIMRCLYYPEGRAYNSFDLTGLNQVNCSIVIEKSSHGGCRKETSDCIDLLSFFSLLNIYNSPAYSEKRESQLPLQKLIRLVAPSGYKIKLA